jgi:hypothetical protein
MEISRFGRCALFSSLAVAMLTGCAGSQPPVTQTGLTPLTKPNAPIARGKSWMLPEAKNEDLLYLSTGFDVYAYSYPKGKLVGSIDVGGLNLCSDIHGNIYLAQYGLQDILEYAHGGTAPIATLSDPGGPWGCSSDPTTGNLAVTNLYGPGGPGNVAIFPNAQNPAQVFSDPGIQYYEYCAYDDLGNLFVDGAGTGTGFAELPKGEGTFTDLELSRQIYLGVIQWDGTHITLADAPSHELDRVEISGSTGTIVSQTRLRDWHRRGAASQAIWIDEKVAIGQPGKNGEVAVWRYPRGGHPENRIGALGRAEIYGVTMSFAHH